PIGIGDAIAVGIGDDVASRGVGADIAGDREPLVGLADDPAIGKALGNLERPVGRAVIDDDDLVIGVVEHLVRGAAGFHSPLGVVGADDDRDARIARQRRRQRTLVARRDRVPCGLWLTFAVDK